MTTFADHVILWDLDGTLTDPKVGITRGVQHALREMGIVVDDADSLTPYIGPPIRLAFAEHHGIEAGDIERAVSAYREYYLDTGIFENRVIAGIPDLLAELAAAGRTMAIATSKVDWMAEKILVHYELRDHFVFVGGATMDGARGHKAEVIEHTLEALAFARGTAERSRVVIIGDREHDVLGARSAGIAAIGVRWGYAEPGELEAAGADLIVEHVDELAGALR